MQTQGMAFPEEIKDFEDPMSPFTLEVLPVSEQRAGQIRVTITPAAEVEVRQAQELAQCGFLMRLAQWKERERIFFAFESQKLSPIFRHASNCHYYDHLVRPIKGRSKEQLIHDSYMATRHCDCANHVLNLMVLAAIAGEEPPHAKP